MSAGARLAGSRSSPIATALAGEGARACGSSTAARSRAVDASDRGDSVTDGRGTLMEFAGDPEPRKAYGGSAFPSRRIPRSEFW